MNILMLTCRKSTELISIKSFRELTVSEQMRLKVHLMTCSACSTFKIQSEFIDQAIDKLSSTDVGDETLPDKRKEQIEKHIHTSH